MSASSVRDTLLRVATQQFADVGFEATTMRSIASKAGVTLPTLYHYYGDKANLYIEVCLESFAPRAERALNAYARAGRRDEQRVLEFFVDLATDLLENESLFKLLHREMIDQDREGIRRLTERCWKQSFTALTESFRALAPGGDAAATVLASFALMFGLVEFRRKAAFLHSGLVRLYTPRALAEFVLATTLPSIKWRTLPEHRSTAESA